MSKIRDKNVDETKSRQHTSLILQGNFAQHNLVKVNRYLLYMVMSLMALVFLLGFFLWPTDNPLNQFKPSHLQQANPALSAEINVLKGQVVALVGGSIESKLRILEESLRSGSVNNALGTIQDLRSDVKMLQSYSPATPAKTPEQLDNQQLLQELSNLTDLLHLTLASVSLMFAAIAGIWIRKQYRLQHDKKSYLSQDN